MNTHVIVGRGVDDPESIAAVLEASGEYRVLRRLRLRNASLPPEGVTTKRAVIVDVETTGLDPTTDEILELAMLAFDYSTDGAFVSPVESFERFRIRAVPFRRA